MNETTDIIKTECGQRVQSSYDEFDGHPAFVIADVATDDAWLSVHAGDELAVDEHR